MKKLLYTFFTLLLCASIYAQAPQNFNYQAVVRNAQGEIITDTDVNIDVSILQGSPTGTEVFTETHAVTTNGFGQVTFVIGSVNTTDMATINWSAGPFYLKISMGGTEMGTSQLFSVPYALYATDAENTFSGSYNDLIDVPIDIDTDHTDDFDGSFTSLTNIPSGLADGDDDTQLNESEVDAFVSNNGYLTSEVDGSVTNELQTLSISDDTIYLTDGGFVELPASVGFSGSYNDLSDVPPNMDTDYTDDFDGSFTSLTDVPSGLADGDDDTQLNEAEVDAFVSDNGYLTSEVDGSVSNEIQTISRAGLTVSLSNGGGTFQDSVLTETEVDAFVSDNGYLTSEVDGSVSNEIQILSMSNDTIYLTNGGFVILPTDTSWNTNGNNVYTYSNVGVGTPNPAGKMEIIGEMGALPEDPLFEVKRSDGQTVFAVYNEGVRVYFDDEAKGARGGFAVGGFSQNKATNPEYLRVTRDSVRIYINDSTSKASRGGFAVGGFSQNKAPGQEFLRVTNDSVRIYVNDATGKASRGGFAVGGFSQNKGPAQEFLRVTNDSVRVYINDENGKASRGGFAVGGFSQNKGPAQEFLRVTDDSVRVYINDEGGKASRGGFAVGGFSQSKGLTHEFLRVTDDSVRVYINDEGGKASRGGFAVGGFSQNKALTKEFLHIVPDSARVNVDGPGGLVVSDVSTGDKKSFMDITPDNYFIGHESGRRTTTGLYNSFIGFESGFDNTDGSNNVFIGYQSGHDNSSGTKNMFLGYRAGYSNTNGSNNLFMGDSAGAKNTVGTYNVFMGTNAGKSNIDGTYNTFMGYKSGQANEDGNYNIFMGYKSGYSNEGQGAGSSSYGSKNIFIGYASGYSNLYGFNNIFIGDSSGYSNYDEFGRGNVFIGEASGRNNYDGETNIFLGSESGYNNIGGGNNIYMGYQSGYSNQSGNFNIFLGYQTGWYNEGSNNTMIGYWSGIMNSTGSGNVFVGNMAGFSETGSDKLYIANTSGTPLIYGDFSSGSRMVVIYGSSSDNGNSRLFYVNGTAGGDYAWYNDSDKRLKKNIYTIPDALDKVLKLRGVNFEWKDENTLNKGIKMGFIAQEAETIIPEVVDNSGDKYSMQYAPVTALLVEAIKEQQKLIIELQDEVKQLQDEKETLIFVNERIAQLENEIQLLKE